ncbi:MAG: hypothetical protein LBQ24_03545 [Candidatus Peribacteria bacterium]|nr:hypothetical protein [Candidatus Peribacteria bacterium]
MTDSTYSQVSVLKRSFVVCQFLSVFLSSSFNDQTKTFSFKSSLISFERVVISSKFIIKFLYKAFSI